MVVLGGELNCKRHFILCVSVSLWLSGAQSQLKSAVQATSLICVNICHQMAIETVLQTVLVRTVDSL